MIDYRDMTDQARAQMDAWFNQRPSFALMGEFSAGKSTLLNVLMGWSVLPAMVTATKLPMIWLTHGRESACHGLSVDGNLSELDSMTPDPAVWDRYAVVRMTLDTPILEMCDVIDTPGISDPRLASGTLRFIADYADFAIWCTAANQAWRQSEKAAWTGLPTHLRDHSILAVTRADKLGSPRDLGKVLKRMQTEAGNLFHEILPIASLQAMEAIENGDIVTPALWEKSGAAALQDALRIAIFAAEAACRVRSTASTLPPVTETAVNEAPARDPFEKREISTPVVVMALKDKLSSLQFPVSKNTVLATIDHYRDALMHDATLDGMHAHTLIRCLSFENLGQEDASKAIRQLAQEIDDFSQGAWCHLDEG